MADAPPAGGTGGLRVSFAVLRDAARQAHQAAGELEGLTGQAGGLCSGAAAAYRGWRLGAELAELGPLWERELARAGSAVGGDGDGLTGAADAYEAVDSGAVDSGKESPIRSAAARPTP